MPTITDVIQSEGALVTVEIGLSSVAAAMLRAQLRAVPNAIRRTALLDTGAEGTAVDTSSVLPQLIQMGVLPNSIGLTNAPALGGLGGSVTYAVDLTILPPYPFAAWSRPPSPFIRRNHIIEDLHIGRLGYDVLIGRDILNGCRFDYDGPAQQFRPIYP